MNDSFFIIYAKYFILLSALVGFYYRNKLKSFNATSLPYFLLLVFLGECFGLYLSKKGADETSSNFYIYFMMPAQILFYIWFIGFKVLQKPKISIALIGLFLLVFIVEIFLGKQTTSEIFTRSFSLGGILLSVLVLLFILKLTKEDAVLTFNRNLFFWVCIGIAIYYTISFPFFTYYNTLLSKYEKVFLIYRNITYHLSVSMYLLFIIGFIWSKKI
jgi:hypothetical protein